jgi:succinate dehydrogenase / fumarate reductase cytochrome b subunit
VALRLLVTLNYNEVIFWLQRLLCLPLLYIISTFETVKGNTVVVIKQRPKNLNLFTIKFPLPAIVSILHRISGVIVFLAIPFILWGLHLSLASPEDFDDLHFFLSSWSMKFVIWGCLSAFIYHFIAGIRHLLMDIHIGDELKTGRLTGKLTLIISIVLIILVGIWLW